MDGKEVSGCLGLCLSVVPHFQTQGVGTWPAAHVTPFPQPYLWTEGRKTRKKPVKQAGVTPILPEVGPGVTLLLIKWHLMERNRGDRGPSAESLGSLASSLPVWGCTSAQLCPARILAPQLSRHHSSGVPLTGPADEVVARSLGPSSKNLVLAQAQLPAQDSSSSRL